MLRIAILPILTFTANQVGKEVRLGDFVLVVYQQPSKCSILDSCCGVKWTRYEDRM